MSLSFCEVLTCWTFVGNMQQRGAEPTPVPGRAPIRPTLLTTPAGQQHLQSLTSSSSIGADTPKDAFGEFNVLNKKKEAPSSVPDANAMSFPNTTASGKDKPGSKVCSGC